MRLRSWFGLTGVVVVVIAMMSSSVANAQRDGAAAIGSISPLAGPVSGGNTLTVRGVGLDRVTAVSFGGKRTRHIEHVTGGRISVTVPKHARGRVGVRLVRNGQVSNSFASYRFVGAPTQLKWSDDHSIDPEVGNIASLSCPTNRFCAAVDSSYPRGSLLTFGPRGPAHRVHLGARTSRARVSCGSATFCQAVADSQASVWNGHRWSGFQRIAPLRADLSVVSCAADTRFCVSLGPQGDSWVHRVGSWTRVAHLPGAAAELVSLSCASRTFCMATTVGHAYRFDGTGWTSASRGLHLGWDYEEFSATCTAPTFCLGNGEYGDGRVWTGTRWRSIRSPVMGNYGTTASCASPSLCVVLDPNGIGVEEYRDGHWHRAGRTDNSLSDQSVSCVHHGNCTAAKWAAVRVRDRHGWSPTRQIEPSSGDLSDIACPSLSWCIAVDGHGNALRHDGPRWTTPRRIDGRRAISAVSCADETFCAAVDGADPYYLTGLPAVGRAIIYANGRWHASRIVDPRFGLTDVSCASPRSCVAVDSGGYATTWNGTRWSAPRHVGAELEAVSCPAPSLCIAVGRQSAVRRSGVWQRTHNPVRVRDLTDVTCTDTQYCVAGGAGGFYIRNRGTWSVAVQHDRGAAYTQVACASRRACFGSEDNYADVWDYAFDGARSAFSNDELYGPKMSCVSGPVCLAVSLDSVTIGTAH